MQYIKQTLKYMLGAFGVLMLVCLPAATVLGVFTKPMGSLSYCVNYAVADIRGFKEMFWLIFNSRAIKHVYPLFLILFSLVFSVALALSVIEKHFRVGKLMLKAPLKQINNYFLPVILTFLILSLILFLYGMIQTGVLTFLHMIISGKGVPSVINVIVACAISLALFVLSVYIACSTMYWAPMMVIYGFTFRDAAAAALRLIDRRMKSILAGVLFPFLVVALLESVFSLINIIYVRIPLAVLLYLFLIMYIAAFIMVSMFDLSDMERRDGKRAIGGNKSGV